MCFESVLVGKVRWSLSTGFALKLCWSKPFEGLLSLDSGFSVAFLLFWFAQACRDKAACSQGHVRQRPPQQ